MFSSMYYLYMYIGESNFLESTYAVLFVVWSVAGVRWTVQSWSAHEKIYADLCFGSWRGKYSQTCIQEQFVKQSPCMKQSLFYFST